MRRCITLSQLQNWRATRKRRRVSLSLGPPPPLRRFPQTTFATSVFLLDYRGKHCIIRNDLRQKFILLLLLMIIVKIVIIIDGAGVAQSV
jgi:hypothetical protein